MLYSPASVTSSCKYFTEKGLVCAGKSSQNTYFKIVCNSNLISSDLLDVFIVSINSY